MNSYQFSVIIPVFNKWALTVQCLESLAKTTSDYFYQVIVLDNASTDETASELSSLGSRLFGEHFCFRRFSENCNFGPACNEGALLAKANILFFLNNDTILTEHWANPLLSALFADPSLGAVGPLLLYPDDTVQHLGVVFTVSRLVHLYRYFPANHRVVCKRYLQVLTGAALMVWRALFCAVGGFWPEYRNGFEDVEFCLRLGQQGKRLCCVPESIVYHLESQSQGRSAFDEQNRKLFEKRCQGLFKTDLHLHGLRDNFLPYVGDNFDLALSLRPEEEAALAQSVQGKPIDFWQHVLRQNPFWFWGREYLANLAEKEEQFAVAILLRYELAFWRRRLRDYENFFALEQYGTSEHQHLFAKARVNFESIRKIQNDLNYRKYKFREIKNSHDRFLFRLYDKALREQQFINN